MDDIVKIAHEIEKEIIDIDYLVNLINNNEMLSLGNSDNCLVLDKEELKAVVNLKINNKLTDLLKELKSIIGDITSSLNRKESDIILDNYAQEKVIEEFAKVNGLPMNREQNIKLKITISTELRHLVKKYKPENKEEERKKKKVMDSLSKNDRTLSIPIIKFLDKNCKIHYKMNVKDGIYTLYPILDD